MSAVPDLINRYKAYTSLLVFRSRYCIVAAYVVQVYDWLLTLGEEARLIHPSRWSAVKIAYLICRYYPLLVYPFLMWAWLDDHDESYCDKFTHLQYALLIPLQISAQAVILIRTYAFTGRKRSVAIILGSAWFALFACEVWLFGTQFETIRVLYIFVGRTGCFADDLQTEQDGIFVERPALRPGLMFLSVSALDLIATVMVVAHCVHLRSTQGPLGRSFLRQGVGVFIVMTSLNTTTAALYLLKKRDMNGIGLTIPLILSDVLACRMILHLRQRLTPTATEVEFEHSELVREAVAGIDRPCVSRKPVLDSWA